MSVSVVRDYDGQVFMREFQGGLLCSGYPPIAKPAFIDEIPDDLKSNRLPEDWDYFSRLLFLCLQLSYGWLDSRVVSVLDSGAEGPGFKSQSRHSRISLRQTVYTHCASVHQAAKLVAALLRVAGVTAGLEESNGSLPPGL